MIALLDRFIVGLVYKLEDLVTGAEVRQHKRAAVRFVIAGGDEQVVAELAERMYRGGGPRVRS